MRPAPKGRMGIARGTSSLLKRHQSHQRANEMTAQPLALERLELRGRERPQLIMAIVPDAEQCILRQ
jgi:hypothetical protein